jgi:hypothetical protein
MLQKQLEVLYSIADPLRRASALQQKNSEACVQVHSPHAGKTIKSRGIARRGNRTKKAPKQFLPALKIRERDKRAYEHAKKVRNRSIGRILYIENIDGQSFLWVGYY